MKKPATFYRFDGAQLAEEPCFVSGLSLVRDDHGEVVLAALNTETGAIYEGVVVAESADVVAQGGWSVVLDAEPEASSPQGGDDDDDDDDEVEVTEHGEV